MRLAREMFWLRTAEQRILNWILRTATGIKRSIEVGHQRVSINCYEGRIPPSSVLCREGWLMVCVRWSTQCWETAEALSWTAVGKTSNAIGLLQYHYSRRDDGDHPGKVLRTLMGLCKSWHLATLMPQACQIKSYQSIWLLPIHTPEACHQLRTRCLMQQGVCNVSEQ